MADDAGDERGGPGEVAGGMSSGPEERGDHKSWTERALSRPGPESPFYVPPPSKRVARFVLYMLYFHIVVPPLVFAAGVVLSIVRHAWFGAFMMLVACAWLLVLGWNRLHGRWTLGGIDTIPELRRIVKE
jgi:hypothetical protein